MPKGKVLCTDLSLVGLLQSACGVGALGLSGTSVDEMQGETGINAMDSHLHSWEKACCARSRWTHLCGAGDFVLTPQAPTSTHIAEAWGDSVRSGVRQGTTIRRPRPSVRPGQACQGIALHQREPFLPRLRSRQGRDGHKPALRSHLWRVTSCARPATVEHVQTPRGR